MNAVVVVEPASGTVGAVVAATKEYRPYNGTFLAPETKGRLFMYNIYRI